MGDSPTCSRSTMSYEDTWNTNEPYDSDFWDECDAPTGITSDSSVPGSPTSVCSMSVVGSPVLTVPEKFGGLFGATSGGNFGGLVVMPKDPEEPNRKPSPESDDTLTENEDARLSSESAVFETPVASQLLETRSNKEEEIHEGVTICDISSNHVFDLPPGKYYIVGWNMNMTGNRLIDEFCQISAYTPKEKFNVFVMPHGNPNNYIRENFGLQITSSGTFRALKDIASRRFLKTRSDVAAMGDFIAWLEEIKGKNDGVVLAFHDVKKLVPLKIIQCVKRFNLLDKFKNVVKGFCNICTLADSKVGETKYFNLKILNNVLLPQKNNSRRSCNKARICYDIMMELLVGSHNCPLLSLCKKTSKRLSDAELIRQVCENIIQHLEVQNEEPKKKGVEASEKIHNYSVTVDSEEQTLTKFEELLERQNSFRVVFKDLMNFDPATRQMINRVRRKIVNQNLALKDVEEAWKIRGYIGLEELFNRVEQITQKEFDLIIEVFERYFDPELESYLEMLINQRKKQKIKQEIKEDLEKSIAKLPKLPTLPEEEDAVKGHRRVKSL